MIANVLPLVAPMAASFVVALFGRIALVAYLDLPVRWQFVGERVLRLRSVCVVPFKPRRLRWVAAAWGFLGVHFGDVNIGLVLPLERATAYVVDYQNWLGVNRVEGCNRGR